MVKSNIPVLYVEDDKGVAEEMHTFLSRRYQYVTVASDGAEGWKRYQSQRPRVLIVDLRMPRLGGLELIRKIRAVDEEIFIIVTSAHSDHEDLLSSIQMGVNRYLVKPINTKELARSLDHGTRETTPAQRQIHLSKRCFYDRLDRTLHVDHSHIPTTPHEDAILHLLTARPNTLIVYDDFEHHIWKDEAMTKYALRTHILNLRKKLPPDVIISNLSGQGYILKTNYSSPGSPV